MTKENQKKKDEEKPKPAEKPKEEPSEYKIKTMVDGDFRLSSKLRERIGFGSHVELKVKILELHEGKSVLLEIEKVDFNNKP